MIGSDYTTGDGLTLGVSLVLLEIPDEAWIKRVLISAFNTLTIEGNWNDDYGDITADQATRIMSLMLQTLTFDYEPPAMIPVGATMTWHVALPPAGWLVCNGQSVEKTTYPELYAVWGGQYGETSTHFTLLDMTDLSPMGSGGLFPVVNGAGGNFNHTLTVDQIPSHSHPPNGAAVFQGSNAGGSTGFEVDIAGQTRVQMTTTGNTGGGLPHPILHPVKAVKWIVYAGETAP